MSIIYIESVNIYIYERENLTPSTTTGGFGRKSLLSGAASEMRSRVNHVTVASLMMCLRLINNASQATRELDGSERHGLKKK